MNNQADLYFAEYRGKRMSEENEEKIFNEMLKAYSVDSAMNYETLRLMFYFLYEVAVSCEGIQDSESFYDFLYKKCIDFTFHRLGAWDFCEKIDYYNFILRASMMLSCPCHGGPENWFCYFPSDYKNKKDIIRIFDKELFDN